MQKKATQRENFSRELWKQLGEIRPEILHKGTYSTLKEQDYALLKMVVILNIYCQQYKGSSYSRMNFKGRHGKVYYLQCIMTNIFLVAIQTKHVHNHQNKCLLAAFNTNISILVTFTFSISVLWSTFRNRGSCSRKDPISVISLILLGYCSIVIIDYHLFSLVTSYLTWRLISSKVMSIIVAKIQGDRDNLLSGWSNGKLPCCLSFQLQPYCRLVILCSELHEWIA